MSELFGKSGPFVTGIADIDSEHAQLHIETKRLAAMLAHGEDTTVILRELAVFTDLMDAHFRHEETFFDRLELGRAKTHRKEHEMLMLSLKLFVNNVKKQREGDDNWNDFISLEDLLLKHIILFDLELRA